MTEFEQALIAELKGINDKLELLIASKPKPIKAAKQNVPTVSQADVDEIYAAYPTTDRRNNNRNLGKGAKSKEIIRKRLQEGRTKEEILDAIRLYVDGSGYLPNFNTFLNNLPCEESETASPVQEKTLWQ